MPELGFGQKAPGIFWENWEKSKESEVAQKVRYFRDEYMGSVRSRRKERLVAKASFDAYIGINGKQWDPVALSILAEQGRPANTFNIIKPNVDKVFGQIVMNPNTINFTPQNQSNISSTISSGISMRGIIAFSYRAFNIGLVDLCCISA